MEELILKIKKILKKISKSGPYCSYLYKYFDELVHILENRKSSSFSLIEENELRILIEKYAAESRYNNFASANWMRYSARCFYCADYLIQYINEPQIKMHIEQYVNRYFLELVEHSVAPIIPPETLDKYIQKNFDPATSKKLYDSLIIKALQERSKCRYWRAVDAKMALSYTKSAQRLIMKYLNEISDYTALKEWLPFLDATHWSTVWNEYPTSGNYEHSQPYERTTVKKCLDEILDIHLKLFSLWFKQDPQEAINIIPQKDLIEILEVLNDNEFEKVIL